MKSLNLVFKQDSEILSQEEVVRQLGLWEEEKARKEDGGES